MNRVVRAAAAGVDERGLWGGGITLLSPYNSARGRTKVRPLRGLLQIRSGDHPKWPLFRHLFHGAFVAKFSARRPFVPLVVGCYRPFTTSRTEMPTVAAIAPPIRRCHLSLAPFQNGTLESAHKTKCLAKRNRALLAVGLVQYVYLVTIGSSFFP